MAHVDDLANLPGDVSVYAYGDKADWLEARKGSTGASSAATMFGVGWRTPLQEYAMATGAMDPPAETEAMRMGHVLQPVARDLYEEETGHKTQDWGDFTILRNEQFPYMHVTLDYPIMQANGEHKAPGVLECKNVGPHMVREWDEGELPLYVQMQVQHQLAITGWEWGAVAAILAGGRFVYDFVYRNENFIQTLASRVAKFWESVKDGTPPEPTADDGEALRLLYPNHVPGKTIELPGEFLDIDAHLQECKRKRKDLEDTIKADENLLKAHIGDAETAILPDGSRYSYKRQVRKAHQVKESETRVLRRLKT
jgi:putative phage-type endonuclease